MTSIQNQKSEINNVLVVGGSGYVASLTLPLLPPHLHLRIFDLNPPAESVVGRPSSVVSPNTQHLTPNTEFFPGDVTNPESLEEAAKGCDLLLYMAMGKSDAGLSEPGPSYDVNVKGLHLALDAAVKAGIKRAIYTSSLSVYDGQYDLTTGETDSEETPAYPTRVYGFTKLLGEQVCHYFHRTHNLPILILRLFLPIPDEQKQNPSPNTQHLTPNTSPDCRTAATDLARALAAALDYEHQGLEIIHLTGDTTSRAYKHEKAKRLLHWEPSF